MKDVKFIEKNLGEKIIKMLPIDTVSKDATRDRSAFTIETKNGHKYFVKYYANKALYNREISGLKQFGGKIAPRLVLRNTNEKLMVTEFIEFEPLGSTLENQLIQNILDAYELSLDLISTRKIDHRANLSKYASKIQSIFPDLSKRIDTVSILDSLDQQPKSGCHGDLHPRNIMVTRNGKVYITDFESTCFDVPILDAIRFTYGPDLKITMPERRNLLAKFIKVLEQRFTYNYPHRLVEDSISYWAITCLGFYVTFCPEDSLKVDSKYRYIVDYCVKVIEEGQSDD